MFTWPGSDKVIARAFREATSGSVDDAITLLRRAARNSDIKGDRAEALGTICYHNSRWLEAIHAFEHALKLQPQNMMRLYFLTSAMARAEQLEGALALLDRAAAEAPADVAPLSARCLILADRSNYEDARKAYEQACIVFTKYPSQECYSMGLLQQCADVLSDAASGVLINPRRGT